MQVAGAKLIMNDTYFEIFVDEGPSARRLKERFSTAESATARAQVITDGKWSVYEIDAELNERRVATGKGRSMK